MATFLQVDPSGAWQSYDPRGWGLKDKTGASDGVQQLKLSTGAAGKSKAQLKARGLNVPTPVPVDTTKLFDQDPCVTVQLFNSEGLCWTSEFSASQRNTVDQFKARAP